MNLKECMAALEGAGSEQTRKTYSRHGAAEPMFGVSFAFLGQLTKKVGTNHELALQLWETGNHDARVFAEMIMDPAQLPQKTLEAWAKTQSGRFACGQFAGLVAKTPHAKKLSAKWRGMKDEWMSMMGWSIVGGLACTKYHCGRPAAGVPGLADADDPGAVTEDELSAFVDEIEAGIANAPNMTKYAMNGALISIGTVSDALFKKAMAAAKRIGTVD
ncbi:MAG: DNA alkylation repair protein, partial [Planctomycetes bacterium]|nr:DNA alkylation repair protein [Planctomycetota bacterium]